MEKWEAMQIHFRINTRTLLLEGNITQINNLLEKLKREKVNLLRNDLVWTMKSSSIITAQKEDASVVGMATLTYPRKLTARFGTLEDVVVDEKYQHFGIADELIRIALELAKEARMRYVMLTSSPEKVAAIALYLKHGFKMGETDCYYKNL